jgi:hypothetical protein
VKITAFQFFLFFFVGLIFATCGIFSFTDDDAVYKQLTVEELLALVNESRLGQDKEAYPDVWTNESEGVTWIMIDIDMARVDLYLKDNQRTIGVTVVPGAGAEPTPARIEAFQDRYPDFKTISGESDGYIYYRLEGNCEIPNEGLTAAEIKKFVEEAVQIGEVWIKEVVFLKN